MVCHQAVHSIVVCCTVKVRLLPSSMSCKLHTEDIGGAAEEKGDILRPPQRTVVSQDCPAQW